MSAYGDSGSHSVLRDSREASTVTQRRLFRIITAMKLSDFASEYDPSELPIIHGTPMENAHVAALIAGKGTAFRVEESLMNLLIGAVYSFYFAKRMCPALDAFGTKQAGPLRQGVREVQESLLKTAVLRVATTIDASRGQTRSLPHALDALKADLINRKTRQPDDEIDATLDLLNHIRRQADAEKVSSLKYVRHLRNKWAGHSSLDQTVDQWAGADKSVDFRLIEDALARMVNAFQDLSLLVPMSQDLMDIEAQGNLPQVLPDGTEKIEMKIAWSGANALAQVARQSAQQGADALIEQLCRDTSSRGATADTNGQSAPIL